MSGSETADIRLIGPFRQVVTMAKLPIGGPLEDSRLEILKNAGLAVVDGRIIGIGDWGDLSSGYPDAIIDEVSEPAVAFPGLIDCHTHICWAGNRAGEYARRLSGIPYLEIAGDGGGIMDTVRHTRAASREELAEATARRANLLLERGVTTIEVKSGYGLDTAAEIKMLEAVAEADACVEADLIPTCLAAHVPPGDNGESPAAYLDRICADLLPEVISKGLAQRVDIFVEEAAFSVEQSRSYLERARSMGFSLTLHADQFTPGGARLAADLGAVSADHLENSTREDLEALVAAGVAAVALPGAVLGLGESWPDARRILDTGGILAIASDWNPGSAPMGDLLLQAALLGVFARLSMAETWAAVTIRAARALGLQDRGSFENGRLADIAAWAVDDWREVLYAQGALKPTAVWKSGRRVS